MDSSFYSNSGLLFFRRAVGRVEALTCERLEIACITSLGLNPYEKLKLSAFTWVAMCGLLQVLFCGLDRGLVQFPEAFTFIGESRYDSSLFVVASEEWASQHWCYLRQLYMDCCLPELLGQFC